MNTGIKHKLYNYELAPPEGAWQKIAEELADTAIGQKFPASLHEYSVTPPSHTWDKIAAALDAALPVEDLPAKLYTAEAVPPIAAWNKIILAMDSDKERSGTRKWMIPFVRYAAAAVIIGLIAFGAMRFFSTGKGNNDTAEKKTIPAVTAPGPVTPGEDLNSDDNAVALANIDADEARNDAALEASKKIYASIDVSKKKRQAIASGFHFSGFTNADNSTGIIDPGTEGIQTASNNIADRYIVLMTPEGNFIRMSKKLSNLVCCVSGEEQDKDCRDQVEKWRKQLACSSAAHPGNFIDILSLVSSLQED